MATISRIFTGLALPLSPSSSNNVCIAKKSLTTPFMNTGSGTVKTKYTRVATSYQSKGGGRRGLLVRASLFRRFTKSVKSFVNAVGTAVEDPEKFKALAGIDDDLIYIHQELTNVLASQKNLENKYRSAQIFSEQWYRKARFLLEKGEEDLAREALKRRKSYDDYANRLKEEYDIEKHFGNLLVSLAKPFASEMQEAMSKTTTPKARRQSSKTATKVSKTSEDDDKSTAILEFEKMEEKEEASGQLTIDDLDRKFVNLKRVSFDDDFARVILEKELAGTKKPFASEMQEAVSKTDTLNAEAQSAKTATEVNEMSSNVSIRNTLAALEKMEVKEAEKSPGQLPIDEVDRKFADNKRVLVDDDSALAILKKELAGTIKKEDQPRGWTFPWSQDSTVDVELKKLKQKAKEKMN